MMRLLGGRVREAADDNPFLLSAPPTPEQRRRARAISLALLAAFLATAPFTALALPQFPGAIVAFGTAFFICDLMTAALLFTQYSIERQRVLLLIAGAFLFSALVAVPYTLTFPNAFAPTGLLGAGLQSTAWLYALWHVGLPFAVIAYVLLRDRGKAPPSDSAGTSIVLAIVVTALLVCASTWGIIAFDDHLPGIFRSRLERGSVGQMVYGSLLLTCFVALALLWLRMRSALDLWLAVALLAMALEIALTGVLPANRYSLGHYASRVYSLISACVVLFSILAEAAVLNVRLARSMRMERREREARSTSLNAMSVSIAHEISQPLGAISLDCKVVMLLLEKVPLDLSKVRGALEHIQESNHHASDIITSIRALFRQDASKRIASDLNSLIR